MCLFDNNLNRAKCIIKNQSSVPVINSTKTFNGIKYGIFRYLVSRFTYCVFDNILKYITTNLSIEAYSGIPRLHEYINMFLQPG